MSEHEPIKDYNAEPVYYCGTCLSLNVQYDKDIDSDFCGVCGGTHIKVTSFDAWEKLYIKKYGKRFIVPRRDPKRSPIFDLPLHKLMAKVARCPKWEKIIRTFYPQFPAKYSKEDSIGIFFDWLIQHGELDDLRVLLYKMNV